MPTNTPSQPLVITHHAAARLAERDLTLDQVYAALDDAVVLRQAGGRLEFRGRNGVTVITDPSRRVILTALPKGAREVPRARRNCGVSRHRPRTRRPQQSRK